MKKRIVGVILIIFVVLSANVLTTLAATQQELQNQSNELQSKINETQEQINQVEKEMSATMQQIQALNTKISEYEDEIDDLDSQIDKLQTSIDETQIKLDEAEANYNKQQKMLETRIVALYEAGETTYLDVLLNSSGLTDFISSFYMVSEIAEYDTELLNQMEKTKNEIQVAKETLQTSKEQIETVKENKEKTAKSLKDSQSVKQSYVNELSEDEKNLQAEKEQYIADKKAVQQQLAAISRSEGTYVAQTPSSYGYICPVPGYRITCGWYGYSGHQGADFGQWGINGKDVLAAKDGTVTISTALKNANGTYRSYGEYVAINHHDGTITLYAHMQPGSRRVSVGDTVVQGQVIGNVGTTGNSTGPHLHFEVWLNGKRVNPAPYLP